MLEQKQKLCDECGRVVAKIHRVVRSHRYCSTCYARVFHVRFCPQCGNARRLPKDVPGAICSKCEASKPCIRCQKVNFDTGLKTRYGRVCNACSPYFRPHFPCDACGESSSRRSRVSHLGSHQRLCPRCQREGFRTCSTCRRFRSVCYTSPDGRPFCQLCNEIGEVPCRVCGKSMPAGRVTRCEECYWLSSATRRINIDREAFSGCHLADEFTRFGNWLILTYGSKTAALSVHKYLLFFLEIERIWGDTVPAYRALVTHFKPEGLRRVRRPMKWLSLIHGIYPDQAIRKAASEEDQIEKALSAFSLDTEAAQAINGYANRLRQRQREGKTSVRSVRLALTPAVGILRVAAESGRPLPNQDLLDCYLSERPGQRAAVTGFINYLNDKYEFALSARRDVTRVRQNRRKKLEYLLATMMRQKWNHEDLLHQWLPVALEYFHDIKVPKHMVQLLLKTMEYADDSGLALIVNGQVHYIPVPNPGIDLIHRYL